MRKIISVMIVTMVCVCTARAHAASECQPALDFYKQYLTWLDADWIPVDQEAFAEKVGNRLTKKCIEAIWKEREAEDYDPVIQGQDWSTDWKKYLAAKLLTSDKNGTQCQIKLAADHAVNVTLSRTKQGFAIAEIASGDAR